MLRQRQWLWYITGAIGRRARKLISIKARREQVVGFTEAKSRERSGDGDAATLLRCCDEPRFRVADRARRREWADGWLQFLV